jgi:hypothetical protein
MTTPANRLIFAGGELVRARQQPELPSNQTPGQRLAAIRVDRKARAQRQRPSLKKPITYVAA